MDNAPNLVVGHIIQKRFATSTGCTGRHMEDKELEEKIRRLLKHYQEHIHNKYNTYAFGFFLCELLNTLVALLSVFLTHKFLLDQYYTFGWEVYR